MNAFSFFVRHPLSSSIEMASSSSTQPMIKLCKRWEGNKHPDEYALRTAHELLELQDPPMTFSEHYCADQPVCLFLDYEHKLEGEPWEEAIVKVQGAKEKVLEQVQCLRAGVEHMQQEYGQDGDIITVLREKHLEDAWAPSLSDSSRELCEVLPDGRLYRSTKISFHVVLPGIQTRAKDIPLLLQYADELMQRTGAKLDSDPYRCPYTRYCSDYFDLAVYPKKDSPLSPDWHRLLRAINQVRTHRKAEDTRPVPLLPVTPEDYRLHLLQDTSRAVLQVHVLDDWLEATYQARPVEHAPDAAAADLPDHTGSELSAMVPWLPADLAQGYIDWVNIGHAIMNAGKECGLDLAACTELFHTFSSLAPEQYDPQAVDAKAVELYASANGRNGFGTIVYHARQSWQGRRAYNAIVRQREACLFQESQQEQLHQMQLQEEARAPAACGARAPPRLNLVDPKAKSRTETALYLPLKQAGLLEHIKVVPGSRPQYWVYSAEHGLWSEMSRCDVASDLLVALDNLYAQGLQVADLTEDEHLWLQKDNHVETCLKKWSKHLRDGEFLKSLNQVPMHWVPYSDGMWHVKTKELRPLRPDDRLTKTLGYPHPDRDSAEGREAMAWHAKYWAQVLPNEERRESFLHVFSLPLFEHAQNRCTAVLTDLPQSGKQGSDSKTTAAAIIDGLYGNYSAGDCEGLFTANKSAGRDSHCTNQVARKDDWLQFEDELNNTQKSIDIRSLCKASAAQRSMRMAHSREPVRFIDRKLSFLVCNNKNFPRDKYLLETCNSSRLYVYIFESTFVPEASMQALIDSGMKHVYPAMTPPEMAECVRKYAPYMVHVLADVYCRLGSHLVKPKICEKDLEELLNSAPADDMDPVADAFVARFVEGAGSPMPKKGQRWTAEQERYIIKFVDAVPQFKNFACDPKHGLNQNFARGERAKPALRQAILRKYPNAVYHNGAERTYTYTIGRDDGKAEQQQIKSEVLIGVRLNSPSFGGCEFDLTE